MTNNNNNNNIIIINHCHHHYYLQLPTELQATLRRLGPTAVEALYQMVTTYRSQTLNASLMRQVLGLIVTLRRHMAAHLGVFRCCRQVLGIAPSTPYWGDFQLGNRFFRVDRDEMVVALFQDDEATLLPLDDFEPHRSPHLVAARCQLFALLRGLIRRNLRRSSAPPQDNLEAWIFQDTEVAILTAASEFMTALQEISFAVYYNNYLN